MILVNLNPFLVCAILESSITLYKSFSESTWSEAELSNANLNMYIYLLKSGRSDVDHFTVL